MSIADVMAQSLDAANKAVSSKLTELQNAGPKFAVYNADLITGKPQGRCQGTMLDVCGFANITMSGTCKLVRELKKIGSKCNDNKYVGNGWFLIKSVYKGYSLGFRTNMLRQELSVNEAAMYAAADVLRDAGYEVKVNSRID